MELILLFSKKHNKIKTDSNGRIREYNHLIEQTFNAVLCYCRSLFSNASQIVNFSQVELKVNLIYQDCDDVTTLVDMEEQTDLFGIPIPSTNKIFLTIVIVHILISLMAVVCGALAMFIEKTSKNHKVRGNLYFWCISLSFVTIVILSVMRWPHNIHLLTIGVFNFGATLTGRQLAKAKPRNWTRLHTASMGFSYILLLTGFYVDNGKNLPFWRMFPEWFFYVFPAAVGIPIIIRVLLSHPLNKRQNH